MRDILKKLRAGDLRSIGQANTVVQEIFDNPGLFKEVFEGMVDSDPLIRMRAADVIEKVSAKYPQYLQPFKNRLINEIALIPQQEVRWHVAQIWPRLKLTQKEVVKITKILFSWLDSNDKSQIVKVMSLQALADFAKRDLVLREKIIPRLKQFVKTGSPSLQSRSRKILKEFERR